MPSLELDNNDALYQIKGYRPGCIKINSTTYQNSLIITPSALETDWPPQQVNQIKAENLQIVTRYQPDILIIGTGEQLSFIPAEIYGDLINQGIGVEVMTTAAACRTYNILSAENRRVVAALIIK